MCPHKRDARRLKFRLCAIQAHGGIIDTVERFDGSAVFLKIDPDHIFLSVFFPVFLQHTIHGLHAKIKEKHRIWLLFRKIVLYYCEREIF